MENRTIFTKLYGPLLVALAVWVLAYVVRLPEGKTFDFVIPYIDLAIPVSSPVVIKLLLVLAGLISLCTYATCDYTSLFQQHLTMEVFHDLKGIRESLQELAPHCIPGLIESADFQTAQQKYFDKVDQEISKLLQIPKFFSAGCDYIWSEGESHTVIRKAKKGLQRYHVETSKGELRHTLSLGGVATALLVTRNKKRNSSYDNLRFKPKDLLHGLLLMTKYDQTLQNRKLDPGVEYDEQLLAATKVTVFPWPDISNTVYLAEQGNTLVPIAYAVLHEGFTS